MPARRPHNKSRHGCARCKQKRVKCDEGRPQCKRCFAVDAECEYIVLSRPDSRLPAAFNPSPLGHEGINNSRFSPFIGNDIYANQFNAFDAVGGNDTFGYLSNLLHSPPSSSQELDLTHLKLMRQYCTSTYRTFDLDEVTTKEWQVMVPELAEQHAYLMHGILSISALHLAVTETDHTERVKWKSLCLKHLDLGMVTYVSLLSSITRENCSALFAFSSLISLFSFGYPVASGMITHPPQSSPQAIESVVSLLTFVRGIHAILNISSQWFADGPLQNIVQTRSMPTSSKTVFPEDMVQQKQRLYALNERLQAEEPEKRAMIDQDIGRLWNVIAILHIDPKRQRAMMGWPIGVNKSYLPLLKSHDPMALVLLACWWTSFKHLNDIWAFSGWGAFIVEAVCAVSDGNLTEILQWPRQQIGLPVDTL